MSLEIFLEMGGYGFYVWTAYGVTAIVLMANLVWPVMQRKMTLRQIMIRQKREQK